MPVVQLQNDAPENLGRAIGAVGGYLATQKQRKADKQQAQADKARTQAREDQEAADRHADIQSAIKERDINEQNATQKTLAAQNALGAYNRYFPMLANPPTPKGQKLTGPALVNALQNIKLKAINEGAFSDQQTAQQRQADFNTEIVRILQEDKDESTRSFLGKEAKTAIPGDPQQQLNFLLRHRLPAERAAGIDTKDTMALISEAQRQINEANTARHQGVMEGQGAQRLQISIDRGASGGGYNSSLAPRAAAVETQAMGARDLKSALKIVEGANLPRRDRTEVRQDVMDQFRQPAAKDTSGLSNAGKEAFNHDMAAWAIGGADPDKQPDPADPKYQKRADALGGGSQPAGGNANGASPASSNGGQKKTVSLKAAMGLPNNKGKTAAQVQADIEAHGYAVAP